MVNHLHLSKVKMCGAISPLNEMHSRHGVEFGGRITFFISLVVNLGTLILCT